MHYDEIPQCQSGLITSGIAVSSASDSWCNRSRHIQIEIFSLWGFLNFGFKYDDFDNIFID